LNSLSLVELMQPVSFVYKQGDGRVRYGFIAEDTAAIDAHLATYDAAGAVSGIDDRSILAVLVGAVKEIASKVSETAHLIIATLTAHRVETDELCLKDGSGTSCYTRSQLDAMVAGVSAGAPQQGRNEAPASRLNRAALRPAGIQYS
jgi:hypothetical protein